MASVFWYQKGEQQGGGGKLLRGGDFEAHFSDVHERFPHSLSALPRIAVGLSVVCCLFVGVALGYKSGAPVSTCGTMKPEHGVNETNENFEYRLDFKPSRIKSGGNVEITIGGGNFRGFLIQARVGDTPVGKFIVKDQFKNVMHLLDCADGSKNAVTHSDPSDKSSVSVTWSAPPQLKETVTF
ncbi:hypothetical protein AAG570_001895 [Ranatra chinensis]|uniref:Reelin domain-containing protein n=1 Tax=Ranatra chinensis TaxID=642074 RepID=A0ABD0Y9U4_9HEMI